MILDGLNKPKEIKLDLKAYRIWQVVQSMKI
jgi:hypothetical protein